MSMHKVKNLLYNWGNTVYFLYIKSYLFIEICKSSFLLICKGIRSFVYKLVRLNA